MNLQQRLTGHGFRMIAGQRARRRVVPVQTIMVRLKSKSVFELLLVAGLCLAVLPATAQTSPVKTSAASKVGKQHSRKKADPVAEAPQTPTLPPTLEQMAPTAPQVSYRNGQLSINAPNSTLSQVLRSVQAQTGASMEMPASASNERVVAQLGPGQPHDVINSLLNGSRFNYIILGVPGDPGAVQKVILTTPKAVSAAANTAQGNKPQPLPQAPEGEAQDDATYVEPEPVPEPIPQPMAPNFRRPMPPGRMPEGNQFPPPDNAGPNGGLQEGAKTPEQLLQELQLMQQQQQQMQEQLNPANRPH